MGTKEDIALLKNGISNQLSPLLPKGSKVAHMDFPDHGNVGDSAIWVGEVNFLKYRRSVVVAVDSYKQEQLPELEEDVIVLLHGGGNLGDVWPRHQVYREAVIKKYARNRIIQLPQSIHFDSEENLQRCRNIFDSHPDLHLLVRDQVSLEIAKTLHDGPSMLCPDMAFMLDIASRRTDPTTPVFCLLRTDHEQDLGKFDKRTDMEFGDWLIGDDTWVEWSVSKCDQIQVKYPNHSGFLYPIKKSLYDRQSRLHVDRGCRLLSKGEVVITDRLHAHILCTLMRIPHVVLDNKYGKIRRFRKAWRTGENLCERADNWDDAVEKAHKLLQTQNTVN